ncbi:MAG: hypothetical protein HYY30_11525 [Chloroflexi bacterium]|nr:hypothetical protein [Chloroflexota bacterium]
MNLPSLQLIPRNRTFWWLFALGSATEITYVLFFVIPFYLPRYYETPLLDLGKITEYQRDAAWRFFAVFFVLFVLYYAGYRFCGAGSRRATATERGQNACLYIDDRNGDALDIPSQSHANRASIALVIAFGLIFSGSLLLIYPITAIDIFDYIFHGRILITYHQNPFTAVVADFPNDPFYPYPAWKYAPSNYGPTWAILSVLPSALGGDSLLLNLLFYKILAVGFFLLAVWLTYLVLDRLAPHYALAGTLLLAWNPLAIFETAGNGHNDSVMAFFLVLSIYFLVANHRKMSVVALTVSSLVKFITGFLLPLFIIGTSKGLIGWRSRFAFVASGILIPLTLTAAMFAPFWNGPETLGIERREEMFTSSIPTLLTLLLEPYVGEQESLNLVSKGSAILFGVIVIWFAVRTMPQYPKIIEASFELLFVYLMFFCLWFQPWYLIWIMPLAALIPRGDVANRMVVFSATATLAYLVLDYLWPWHIDDFDTLAVQGRLVAVVFPLPFLLTVHGMLRNRIDPFAALEAVRKMIWRGLAT